MFNNAPGKLFIHALLQHDVNPVVSIAKIPKHYNYENDF